MLTDEEIAFLRARLEEDESHARATLRPGGPAWPEVGRGERIPEMAHIERHAPARVLREVEAKRAILDAYVCADGDSPRDRDRGRWDALHAAVSHLAAIWSDHPDYRQEWAP